MSDELRYTDADMDAAVNPLIDRNAKLRRIAEEAMAQAFKHKADMAQAVDQLQKAMQVIEWRGEQIATLEAEIDTIGGEAMDTEPVTFERMDIAEAYEALEEDYAPLPGRGGDCRSVAAQLRRMGFESYRSYSHRIGRPAGLETGAYNSLHENGKAIYRNFVRRHQLQEVTA